MKKLKTFWLSSEPNSLNLSGNKPERFETYPPPANRKVEVYWEWSSMKARVYVMQSEINNARHMLPFPKPEDDAVEMVALKAEKVRELIKVLSEDQHNPVDKLVVLKMLEACMAESGDNPSQKPVQMEDRSV